jgi:hypothetical protein
MRPEVKSEEERMGCEVEDIKSRLRIAKCSIILNLIEIFK